MDAVDRYSAPANATWEPPRPSNAWDCFLRLLLVLWIVRVPLTMTLLGLALLGLTPQAQDLFMEFARTTVWWMLWFLLVLIFLWAMPTHYAARLLLDTDSRFSWAGPYTRPERTLFAGLRHLGATCARAVDVRRGPHRDCALGRQRADSTDTATKAAVHRALIEMTAL